MQAKIIVECSLKTLTTQKFVITTPPPPPPQIITIKNLKSPDFCWKNILIDAPCKNLVLVTQKKLIWAMWSMIISSKMAC
jgi:hypothetical protein